MRLFQLQDPYLERNAYTIRIQEMDRKEILRIQIRNTAE